MGVTARYNLSFVNPPTLRKHNTSSFHLFCQATKQTDSTTIICTSVITESKCFFTGISILIRGKDLVETSIFVFFLSQIHKCKYNMILIDPYSGLCFGSLSAWALAAWLPLFLPRRSNGWRSSLQSSCPLSQPHSASPFYWEERGRRNV